MCPNLSFVTLSPKWCATKPRAAHGAALEPFPAFDPIARLTFLEPLCCWPMSIFTLSSMPGLSALLTIRPMISAGKIAGERLPPRERHSRFQHSTVQPVFRPGQSGVTPREGRSRLQSRVKHSSLSRLTRD